MKKWTSFFRVFNVLLLASIIFLGYKLYPIKKMEWEKAQIDKVIDSKENQIKKSHPVSIQSGMIRDVYVSAAYPLDKDGNKLPYFENEMLKLISKRYGNDLKENKISKFAFIQAKVSGTSLAKVKKYQIHAEEFTNKSAKLKSDKVIIGRQFYLKEDGEVFSLTDLVTDSFEWQNIFVAHTESLLSEKGQLDDVALMQLDSLRAIAPSELEFQIKDNALEVQLPEQIGDLKEVTLPFEEQFEVINDAYLKDETLSAYRSYMEEKNRVEVSMHAGGAPIALSGKVVALTFDDGPSPANTPQILDILAKYKAKATFYVIGGSIPGNEAILKRALAEGHEIGNHTWTHPDLQTLPIEVVQQEIKDSNKLIESSLGIKPKTFRPPYGSTNPVIASVAGLHQALWDIDTLDWQNRDPQAILAVVQSQLKPGATILMHDIHGSTVEALPLVLDYLVSQGYTFATFSELYAY